MSSKPTPLSSLSVTVQRTENPADLPETAQKALEEALKTDAGEKFKSGSSQELVVAFRSVGP
jgi:hypothetical protein